MIGSVDSSGNESHNQIHQLFVLTPLHVLRGENLREELRRYVEKLPWFCSFRRKYKLPHNTRSAEKIFDRCLRWFTESWPLKYSCTAPCKIRPQYHTGHLICWLARSWINIRTVLPFFRTGWPQIDQSSKATHQCCGTESCFWPNWLGSTRRNSWVWSCVALSLSDALHLQTGSSRNAVCLTNGKRPTICEKLA